jgi:arylsulfatase A-like enzyme
VAVLTADHGFADTPEWAASQGRDAGRISSTKVMAELNAGLVAKFGVGPWALHFSAAGILFDEQRMAAQGIQPAAMYQEAKRLLLPMPGIADVFTLAQMQGTDRSTPYLEAMRKSWHPEVAAPLQIVVKPGWLFGSRPTGSSHGTPYAYDTQVPILAWGPTWVGRGEVTQQVEVADIAPSLAKILRVRAPAQSQGQVLPWPVKN